ncbi:MAG: DUF128 domain-containing protein [Methanomicrobiales archaeon]|jgi:repressor of nif and glnA expression|nr:DUF128 domain-containing protein [Methanomicrobiales archaeon]
MVSPLKFISHTIEDYAVQVTYNPDEGSGNVVYNLSLIRKDDFETAVSVIRDACMAGISVSSLVKFSPEGEYIGDFKVPSGHIGIVTVCSSTLDGVLMKRGVPLTPIGGGVVEVDRRVPRRFTHIILYEHTTIDPLQVLGSQDITSITDVMRKGSGNILANIRECHMEAEAIVEEVLGGLTGGRLGGILEVGLPNTPTLGVPVSPQYIGVVAVGGTNPVAAIKERGVWVNTHAIKGLIDVAELQEIREY